MPAVDMECTLCGYGPIKAGLSACQGCGASISYRPRQVGLQALLFVLAFVGWAIGLVNVGTKGTGSIGPEVEFTAAWWLGYLALLVVIRIVNAVVARRNRAIGRGWFRRPKY